MSDPARRNLDLAKRFIQTSLLTPDGETHDVTPSTLRRRRVVVGCTLLVGVVLHGYTLRLPPGDDRFYLGTAGLALIWGGGAWLSGPLRAGAVRARDGMHRPWLEGLVFGAALLIIFLVGAVIVAHIPMLREPVEALLAHASSGSLAIVAALTFANGIVEELFYRGALYDAVPLRYAVAVSTAVYAAVTAAAGIPLLTFAAVILGAVTALQRRATGGVLAPMITHVVWSLGMLFLLPPALAFAQ